MASLTLTHREHCRVLLQVITMPDARYAEYCQSSDFIRAHIFPGGHLPSLGAMMACATPAHLAAVALQDIGPSYAMTLRQWRANWARSWRQIQALGYPDSFMRKCVQCLTWCSMLHVCGWLCKRLQTYLGVVSFKGTGLCKRTLCARFAAVHNAHNSALRPDVLCSFSQGSLCSSIDCADFKVSLQ